MRSQKPVIIWLCLLCFMVLGTLVVGGLTRLTDSGLSMVDWRPLMGVIPPLSEQEWIQTFNNYKAFPEYLKINEGMSLSEFKYIFMWEYLHRILARSLSLVFLIPWLYFIVTKTISSKFALKSFVGFLLGGCQGLLGWYMVKSGLVDKPDVSHYRLAAHLSLAIFIYSYFLWLILDLTQIRKQFCSKMRYFSKSLIAVTALQIVWGAFTGGLKAGYIYNSFPKMNDSWLPQAMFYLSPWWINFFENPGTVQLVHRTLAWVLFFAISFMFVRIHSKKQDPELKTRVNFVFAALLLQFFLGVANLLYRAPIQIAIVHQFCAVVLLSSLIVLVHKQRA